MIRRYGMIAVAVAAVAAVPAQAQRSRVEPYIEASQVFASDLDGGDVLTYTTVAAGVDATVETRRVEVQVSYRYEHRFDYDDRLNNSHTHSGLAQARATLTRDLTLEGGAIATRTRSDVRGDALTTTQGNLSNSSQVYSAYIGPNLATHVGPAFLNAAYRFGYSKVEAPGETGVSPGAPRLDTYDDSRVHVATASMGVKSGAVLPVGLTVSGNYTREDAGQLDQRFESKFGRGDVVLPVSRSVAIGAGVGYEDIRATQRDPLLTASGAPVIDGNGRFVTDPASPRRLAYDMDGIFWDAGVIWRPSPRTFLEARVGRRYGTMSYTGSFSHQIGRNGAVQVGVYDTVTTFGQQLNGNLAALPDNFSVNADPFGNQFTGCVYGTGGAGTGAGAGAAGGCLNGVFASAATSAYRARGITGVLSGGRGGTHYGLGAGYARRNFLAPSARAGITIDGTSDETYFAQLFASTIVGPNGTLSGQLTGDYYDTDLPGGGGVYGWGANGAYTHSFGRLGATVSAGVFGYDRDGDSAATAQALLALRYGF